MDVKFDVPVSLINSHALFWPGFTLDFVLKEPIVEWLAENNLIPEITPKALVRHLHPCADDHDTSYNLTFGTIEDATLFKLRWFGE